MRHAARLAVVIGIWCGSALLGAATAHAECEPQRVADKYPLSFGKPVRIAATISTLPFAYSDRSNLEQMAGIEVEMVEFAMRCAGLRYEYVKGPFSSLIQSVMSGATDVMIGNVNYRPERAEKVDFVIFMRSGQSVIVAKGNPKGLRSIDDLCGATGSSTVGGVSSAEVERQSAACIGRGKSPIHYIPSVDQEAAVRQLTNGRVEFVMDGSISAKLRSQADNRDLEIGFTILTDLLIGPVVRKDNDEIRRAVFEGIQTMEREGKLKALLAKYDLSEFGQPVELKR